MQQTNSTPLGFVIARWAFKITLVTIAAIVEAFLGGFVNELTFRFPLTVWNFFALALIYHFAMMAGRSMRWWR